MEVAWRPSGAGASQQELDRIEQAGVQAGLARPEGRRLSELATTFVTSDRLPPDDPIRRGIEYFLRRRLRDPGLARSAGGLVEHIKVASGARQGMKVFDFRKDTSPNHAETIVLAFEALVLSEQRGVSKYVRGCLESLLNPAQSGFRRGKSDAVFVQQIAQQAISTLHAAEMSTHTGY